jgi:hypothetical protein
VGNHLDPQDPFACNIFTHGGRSPQPSSQTWSQEPSSARKAVTGEFTVRRMKALEPRILEIVTSRLDTIEPAGPPADLVAEFATAAPLSAAGLRSLPVTW